MALTTCGECKGNVSTGAAACPHCGARFHRPGYARAIWVVLAFVVMAGIAAGFILNGLGSATIADLVLMLAILNITLLFWYMAG